MKTFLAYITCWYDITERAARTGVSCQLEAVSDLLSAVCCQRSVVSGLLSVVSGLLSAVRCQLSGVSCLRACVRKVPKL